MQPQPQPQAVGVPFPQFQLGELPEGLALLRVQIMFNTGEYPLTGNTCLSLGRALVQLGKKLNREVQKRPGPGGAVLLDKGVSISVEEEDEEDADGTRGS